MSRIYTIFTFLFWLTMMGLLFHKEVLPSLIITSPKGYEICLDRDNPIRESWMGIYFKEKRIGFTNTVINQDIQDAVAGYRVSEISLLKLSMLGEDKTIRIKGDSFFDENFNLRSFGYRLDSGKYRLRANGKIKKNQLFLELDSAGQKIEKIFPAKEDFLVSNSISPFFIFRKFKKDTELNFSVFDPITLGVNNLKIKKTAEVYLDFGAKKIKANIIEAEILGIKTRTWITDDGEVLKEESPLGWVMLKESPDTATTLYSGFGQAEDLFGEFSIPSNIEILNPREVSYLKIEVFDKERKNILEIIKDSEPKAAPLLPIEKIPEEVFIQSDDPKIHSLAMEIIGDEKNSWLACKRITNWVYRNLKKSPTLSVPSALDVLSTREGDCNEHTVFFTALARSVGIPTKMNAGLIYFEGNFLYHAWPKVYVGKWIDVDPTLGQEIADATHIPLVEGNLEKQLELLKVVGNLEVRVLEYR